jgi:PAS domain S-box-containing protein
MSEADRFPFGLLSVALDGTVVEANRQAQMLAGGGEAPIVGQRIDRLLTAGSRLLYHTYLLPLLQLHGQVQEFAMSLVAGGGQVSEVLVFASLLRDREPAAIELALFSTRERARIERELLRVQRVADAVPGMLFEYAVDAEGRGHFPYASAGAFELYGLRPEQLAHSDEPLLSLVHPDDRAALAQTRRQASPRESAWSGTYRARRRHGGEGWAWHAVRSMPRVQADGSVVWHGVVTDITHQREMELADEARKAAEQASRAKTEFLARMSHELRTPLNGIIGFAHLLAGDAGAALDDEQRRRLGIIESCGQRLVTLIDEVLDISRIEAGRVDLQAVDVPLLPLLGEALQVVEPMARVRGVELKLDTSTPLVARADADRLAQVTTNLLSNAVKYNRPRGRVDVSVQALSGEVRIEVRDTGLGMNEMQLSQLFQPFNRLGAERTRTEGTGLGLVITRNLVELMGGRLQVNSEPGRGTVMSVVLPQGALAGLAAQADAGPASVSGEEGLGPRRVLYVEDNAVNVMLLEAMLESMPQVVLHVAEDGATALAAAQAERPDLLLLDMNLPDTDGCTLLARLRGIEGMATVPAVVVSADAMPHQVEQARRAGFHSYWTKPLDVERVRHDVQRLLASPGAGGDTDTTVSAR